MGNEGPYPDIEVEVFVSDGLDVEAYCRYGCDYLADLVRFSVRSTCAKAGRVI